MTLKRVVRSYTPTAKLHWERFSPNPNTMDVTGNGYWYESDLRDIIRNDPLQKHLHGDYRREMSFLNLLPGVYGKLVYQDTSGYPIGKYQIDVSGNGFGFPVQTARYLYASESNRLQLINNAIKGAREEQVNLALFIGELDKTGSLLAESASKIAKSAEEIRKGKFARAARTLGVTKPKKASRSKKFSDNWLAFSYGWSPIVSDIASMMKHLSKEARGVTVRSKSRIGSSVPMFGNTSAELTQEGYSVHRFQVNWAYVGTWHRMEQVQLVFRLSDEFWDQVSRLGFMDPGTLAWESIPLSFVVDWFANIGDLLNDVNRGLTLTYQTGSYVEYHRNIGNITGTPVWLDKKLHYKYTKETCSVDPCVYTQILLKRTALYDGDVAVSFLLSCPLSLNHAITSTALVVQRLK